MMKRTILIRRQLSTERADIGSIFINPTVHKLLKEITRFKEEQVFERKPVSYLKTPRLMFMTDEQLKKAKDEAYEMVKARLQMPPVLAPDQSEPKVLARDPEIVGYTKHKIMFVDISIGYTNRNRLMSVREVDGTLRFPTNVERSRLNETFFSSGGPTIGEPKIFQGEHLMSVLKRKEYVHVLNRACIQYEPDDPRYTEVTSKVYTYIDDKGHHNHLRSTRHFGPMCLYLAYEKRADRLILEMLSKGYVEDAAKLVKIYNTCHNIEFSAEDDDLTLLQNYSDASLTGGKHNLDLALQSLRAKAQPKVEEAPAAEANDEGERRD